MQSDAIRYKISSIQNISGSRFFGVQWTCTKKLNTFNFPISGWRALFRKYVLSLGPSHLSSLFLIWGSYYIMKFQTDNLAYDVLQVYLKVTVRLHKQTNSRGST